MRFITYRWAFRYLIWSLLLWRVGRLGLHLMPTHPDRAAGLGFLTVSQRQFGILFAALGCAFAGRVANSMWYEGASLGSLRRNFKWAHIQQEYKKTVQSISPLVETAGVSIEVFAEFDATSQNWGWLRHSRMSW
jgi:hypothetical protein